VDGTQVVVQMGRILIDVATTAQKTWTDEELMALPGDGKYELVDGELLRMSPAGGRHGEIVLRLAARLLGFVAERKLGHVFDGQTGFRFPDTNLRSPDVSFVATDRLPDGVPAGFLHVAPDLAVEVLSPSDRAADLAHKVAEYLAVGVRLLWVIDPEKETAVVYRTGSTPRTVRQDGVLDGEDVLPGFCCALSGLLD
jgi:Uma2 family endonuclease